MERRRRRRLSKEDFRRNYWRRVRSSIIGVVPLVFIAAAIFYLFAHHIALINTCGPNQTLLVSVFTGPECLPPIDQTFIAYGLPYSTNSSLVVSGGTVIPLDFRFLGTQPLFYIWTNVQAEPKSLYVFLTLPDSFKMHMEYVTNTSTDFMVMTNEQYIAWINSGQTSTNNSLLENGTFIDTWVNSSSGCAGYVAVIKSVSGSAFEIFPNETAVYAPSSTPTGACAS